jgi:oligoribonuclease (3'-5' exoribonuclease)
VSAPPATAPLSAADAARHILETVRRQPALRVPLDDALDRVRDITLRYPQSPLLGRNVGSFDRAFLEAQRAGVLDAVHYKCLDLSALLLYWQLYYPVMRATLPKPEAAHRAMCDVRGDIALLRAITSP